MATEAQVSRAESMPDTPPNSQIYENQREERISREKRYKRELLEWFSFPLPLYRMNCALKAIFGVLIGIFFPVYLISVTRITPGATAIFSIVGNLPLLFRPLVGKAVDYGTRRHKRNNRPFYHTHDQVGMEKRILYIAIPALIFAWNGLVQLNPATHYFTFVLLYIAVTLARVVVDVVINHIVLGERHRLGDKISISIQVASLVGALISVLWFNLSIGGDLTGGNWHGYFMGITGGLCGFYLLVILNFWKKITNRLGGEEVTQPAEISTENSGEISRNSTGTALSESQKRNIKLWLGYMVLSRLESMSGGVMGADIVARFGVNAFRTYSEAYSYAIYVKVGILLLLFIYKERLKPYSRILLLLTVLPYLPFYAGVLFNNFPLVIFGTVLGMVAEPLGTFGYLLLYMEITPDTNRSFWFQLFSAVGGTTIIIAQAGGLLIWEWANTTIVYIVALTLGLLAFIPIFNIKLSPIPPDIPGSN